MWCSFCGRRDDECLGGVWRGPARQGRQGICVYCARSAVRALDPLAAGPAVVPIMRRPPRPPEPPEAA